MSEHEEELMRLLESFRNTWVSVAEEDGTVRSYGQASPTFMVAAAKDLLTRLCKNMEDQPYGPEDKDVLVSLVSDLVEAVEIIQRVERVMGAIAQNTKFAAS